MKPAERGRLARRRSSSTARRCSPAAAGSGESEIRRWIIENDWLEAVVALPDQLFYNTGISTYVWIVTNRKAPERRGKVQLVDAREFFVKMRKSLGEKRKEISADADRRDHPPLRRLRRGRARSRSSRTRRSASCGSPSSGRCGCAGRSPTTRSPRSSRPRPIAEAARAMSRHAVRELLRGASRRRSSRPSRSSSRLADRRLTGLGLASPAQKAVWAALAVRDPERSGHHRPQGQSRARSRPSRQRERPAARGAGDVRGGPDGAARDARVPHRGRRLHARRGAAVRARRLGRPRQDQDRLRDPAHPALLQVRAAAAAGGDRRRDQGAREARSSDCSAR